MKVNYWHSSDWPEPGSVELVGLTAAKAKRQLREKGGSAFANVFDRKGKLVETIAIELDGSNPKQEAEHGQKQAR